MEYPNYFSILPATVRYDKRLGKPNAKILYSEITALSNRDGYCHASNTYFAKLYDVDSTTISKWISLLVKYGYLEREEIYYQGTKQLKERRLYPLTTPLGAKNNPPLGSNAKENNILTNIYDNQFPLIESFSFDLNTELSKLTFRDEQQKADTIRVLLRYKDKFDDDLLLRGIKRIKDNQDKGKKIINVAGYLTQIYKEWLELNITTLKEAQEYSRERNEAYQEQQGY